MEASAPDRTVSVAVARPEPMTRDPRLAFALALGVFVLVFFVIWRIRKTFGMKS